MGLSRGHKARPLEWMVEKMIFLVSLSAILMVFLIFVFVAREAFPIFLGKAAVVVALEPVGVVEARADLGDRVADAFLLLAEREVHADLSPDDGAAVEASTAPCAMRASISSTL